MPSTLSTLRPLATALAAALTVLAVVVLTHHEAHAQGRRDRDRIVVAVIPSGDVPPGIDRDVQDLFLTALADQGDFDLVDRETVYELTDLQGDVDLLLCVTRESCIQRLHDEHRFVHYVLVKVTEQRDELEFTYVTFNYKNRDPIVFGDRYGVAINDHVEFVNRAFAVADALELKPLDEPIDTDPCAAVLCPKTQRCTEGRCVDIEVVEPELPPEEPDEPIDWPLIAGITTTSVGVVLTGVAGGLYIHRQMRIDDFAAGYEGGGPSRIHGSMDQQAAHDEVASINTETTIAHILLGVGLATTAAGVGVLTWALLDDGETDARESVGQVTIHPGMLPGGAALGATFAF